jgi:hypothetical protein
MVEINPEYNVYIKNKLIDLEPSFDFSGIDKLVYSMCITDFNIYVTYIKRTHMNINSTDTIFQYFDAETLYFNIQDMENNKHFIEAWTEWWFNKYKQRVKLIFTQDIPSSIQLNNNILSKFSSQEINEIKEAMRFKLIEKGDICGSMIIVDSMFIKILSQYSDKIDWNISAKLNILNVMLREMHKMALTKGPLIFIKPTKQVYGIKDYRDTGTMTPVKQ